MEIFYMFDKKWDFFFLGLAEHISTASKDPSTKVGAVIVAPDRRVVSMGYNGLPRGVEDTPERLNNRELKYQLIVHAERNALLFAREPLDGYTLYTTPFAPCSVCAGMIIQAGIKNVVSYYVSDTKWLDSFKLSSKMFVEAGVSMKLYLNKEGDYRNGY